eukprot:scaffold266075_cov17-Tisochrysis_lutea.AAC.1
MPTPSPAATGSSSSSSIGLHGPPADGLAAVVVKPARLGGIEAALGLAAAAGQHGIRILAVVLLNGVRVRLCRRCAEALPASPLGEALQGKEWPAVEQLRVVVSSSRCIGFREQRRVAGE